MSARLVRDAELDAAIALRRRVFCGEQGVSEAEELDGRDAEADHLVALGEDGTVVGTCRLLAEDAATLRLGRMAVAPEARGRGVAQELLHAAHAHARERGMRRMTLHAQLTARSVYARAGYAEHGEHFLDAGIEHVTMERDLA